MTREELDRILAAHKAWLNNEPGGNQANLRGADLRWADLSRADLSGAVGLPSDYNCAVQEVGK